MEGSPGAHRRGLIGPSPPIPEEIFRPFDRDVYDAFLLLTRLVAVAVAAEHMADLAPQDASDPRVDDVTVQPEKKERRLRKTFGYLHLLVSASPEPLDIGLLVVGIVASIAAGIPFPLLGILFGELVDNLNANSCASEATASSNLSAVSHNVTLVVYVTIANFFSIYIATGCWSLFGERLVRRLRYGYLQALLRQEISYFETLTSGEVASRLDSDLHAIQAGVSEKVGILIQSISYFVAAYVVALIKDAKLAGMLFSLVPAYFLMAFAGGYFTKKYVGAVNKKVDLANSIASESLANIKLVKAFGAAKRMEEIFVGHLAGTRKDAIGKILTAATQMGLLYFLAYSANALAISQGGRQIAEAIASGSTNVTVGNVYTVIFVLVDASYIISQVAPFLTVFAGASEAADKLFSTMHRDSQIDGSSQSLGEKLPRIEGSVEFRNVSFRYPARREVLAIDDLNLVIPAKKMTGIVGLSGSGKSTVAAFTERLYDPDEGTVFIDGRDVRELNPRHLRGHIGLVEQNPVLLDRSVLENIAYGLVGSSKLDHERLQELLTSDALPTLVEAVRSGGNLDALAGKSADLGKIVSLVKEAARLAGVDVFIPNLQSGYATSVGSGGGHLSGGQKQRVALARALVRDPSILILDEATASLDSTTEAAIQSALESLPGSRTIISIAHRLSTVKNADNIVVMQEGGKVVEQGTYNELVALGGVFASMVGLQTLNRSSATESERSSVDSPTVIEKQGTLDRVLTEKEAGAGEDSDESAKDVSPDELKRSFFSTFNRIIVMVRPQLFFVVAGVFAAAIVGGSHSGEAVIFGNTIGRLNVCRSSSDVESSASLFGLLFFLLALLEFFANVISAAAFGWVAEKLLLKTRTLSLRALLGRDLQWHESGGRTAGTLMSYISADATAMSGLTGTILGVTFSVVVNMLSGIILAHAIAWKIALVLLACVPILLASGFLRIRVQAHFAERHAKAFTNSVAIATEAVSSIRTVTAFSLQLEVTNTFSRSLTEPYKATVKTIAFGNFWLAMAFSVGNFIYSLAYWWGAKLQVQGEYTQTQFFIVLPALLFAAQTSGQLFSLAPDASKAGVAAKRVLALIDPKFDNTQPTEKQVDEKSPDPEQNIAQGSLSRPTDKGVGIAFQNVVFSYPSRPAVTILRGVSFSIPPGSFAAFVGTSGAGKSTIMSLLEHFYAPSSGSILLDHYDIARCAPSSATPPAVLDDIGIVPQEPVLFSGTIAFNIGLGAKPGTTATQADIEAAAKLACIHDTIAALPQGYETLCGPAGSQVFSGGQKQRMCIARALVRKPRLLLLDESSSALDAESEALWEQALDDIRAQRNGGWGQVTVVAIAHRLRTIMNADKIYIMEQGQIIDSGRHTELLERCEKYRNDVVHQSLA
ncbi:putative ABC transporter [Thozetella sp. PMI_491]|nr:putative ABC transporter [Thozetella sp. PMI_491]